jgi:tripartite-type tricarboxylate transporter receptor subunit TctC
MTSKLLILFVHGLGGGPGTPKQIVSKINGDLNRILALPDMKERELTLGYRFIGGSPDELAKMFRAEITKWADVANNASLK